MTETNLELSEPLAKHGHGDILRTIAASVLQVIMEALVEGLIGAGRYERSAERTLNLRVPKLRQESYCPGFPEARKTSGQSFVAVVQQARIGGVSTRRFDELVQGMPCLTGDIAMQNLPK